MSWISRTLRTCLIGFFFGGLALGARAQGVLTSNSVTYQTINNTTNYGQSSIIGTATIQGKQVGGLLQNGGLATTNALVGWFQISLGNTNSFSTVQIYVPASTNQTIDTVPVSMGNFTVYGRWVLVTTNSVNAGAQIQLMPFVP